MFGNIFKSYIVTEPSDPNFIVCPDAEHPTPFASRVLERAEPAPETEPIPSGASAYVSPAVVFESATFRLQVICATTYVTRMIVKYF